MCIRILLYKPIVLRYFLSKQEYVFLGKVIGCFNNSIVFINLNSKRKKTRKNRNLNYITISDMGLKEISLKTRTQQL